MESIGVLVSVDIPEGAGAEGGSEWIKFVRGGHQKMMITDLFWARR